ncbi:hypothetical protein P4S72_23505 [Vibrio sp. PP-XX7]
MMLVPVNHDVNILQPKLPLYLYQRIESFLYQVCPPGLSIRVRDPSYEEVAFDVALKIQTGYDIDAVVSGINQKLIDFLTPWVGDKSQAASFRKVIYLTELAGMLEQHPAVDTVHYIRATVSGEQGVRNYDDADNIIEPSGDENILVPSRNHKVVLVDQDVAVVEGVGKWRIEIDFTVT